MTAPAPPPPDARFLWPEENPSDASGGPPRQSWALFRFAWEVGGVGGVGGAGQAVIHLFASHAYRLRLNGEVVAYGPGRFVPGHEQFDTHDLGHGLRPGGNVLEVLARFSRQSDFQTMPGGEPGFIAWGHATDAAGTRQDFTTPGGWTGRALGSRADEVASFSFAVGPVEVLDAARDAAEHAAPAGLLRVQEGRPAPTTPRSVAYPPHGRWQTPELLGVRAVVGDEEVRGYVPVLPAGEMPPRHGTSRLTTRYAVFLRTDAAQELTLAVHWGPHWLNGEPLEAVDDPTRGNRQHAAVSLRAGWNLLCGEPAQLQSATPVLIGWPEAAGLDARARPSLGCADALRYLPPADRSNAPWANAPPAGETDLPGEDAGWIPVPLDAIPACPARHMAWDRYGGEDAGPWLPRPIVPGEAAGVETPEPSAAGAFPVTLPGGGAHSLLLDFREEYLGHVAIDVEAPAGTLLDVAYGEHLRADGAIGLFATNPFVETADRFVLAGGRETLETFFPRGGRYVQVTVRPVPGAAGPAVLHGLRLRSARAWTGSDASFACSHPTWKRAWGLAQKTLEFSTEDTFCDSPWRERGTYLGDSYVQALSRLATGRDHRVVGRSLALFAQSQRPDGQMLCVAPSCLGEPHADFSLIFALWLRDAWARTGRRDWVESYLPAVDRVLGGSSWVTSTRSPLWNSPPALRNFVDWGARREHRTLDENATLNAFRLAALEAAAELHDLLGDDQAADAYRREREEVLDAWNRRLWIPGSERFAPGYADGARVEEPSLHTQVLALAFGLCNDARREALATHVADRLLRNTAHAVRGEPADDFAELYFLQYAFEAMRNVGRFDVIATLVSECQAVQEQHGAWAYWECLHRGVKGGGSWCHAWSTACLPFFTRDVLGVREAEPGRLDRLVIDPKVEGIDQAEGSVPHPDGPVRVAWRREPGGALRLRADGPEGVTLVDAEGRTPEATRD